MGILLRNVLESLNRGTAVDLGMTLHTYHIFEKLCTERSPHWQASHSAMGYQSYRGYWFGFKMSGVHVLGLLHYNPFPSLLKLRRNSNVFSRVGVKVSSQCMRLSPRLAPIEDGMVELIIETDSCIGSG